tara:strand:+ start:275 stop:1147 length:873 start_codon:yes stop_codon:yes gene_type:complete
MITFVQLGKHGRLGNQLFQYAALKSIALENGYECKIPNPDTMEWHGQKCLLSEFNIEANFLTQEDMRGITNSAIEPSHHHFFETFLSISDNTNIHGYFQSTYYFDKHKEQISKELTPKEKYITEAQETLNSLREDGSEIVSIHLRRGDMVDGTNQQYSTFYGEDDIYDESSVYGKYISNALQEFENKKVKFLVFSGGSRTADDTSDILWAKNTFKKDNFFVSETNDPMKDFALIMSCDHNIVCHLTTFGWWAAYLNKNLNKIVVAPKDYFYDEHKGYMRPGFFPSDWKII